MKKVSCIGLLLLATVGCGGKPADDSAQTAGSSALPAPATGTPASTAAVVSNGAGTEPGEVVALFLDSLRRGDETTANSVLTTQAQTELAKTDYVIEPLGTPEGKYQIGRVGYVDNEKTTGLVECTWSEPSPEAGKPPIEMELVCEVHKEQAGWRISGLAVKMAGTEETFVLDFENANSLQSALENANGQGAQPQPQNVAAQSTAVSPVTLPAGTPEVPSQLPPLPGQGIAPGQPAQPTTQIALPPLPGAPTNR